MPKLSIITPVYRVEEDIRQCLDSIINQDFQDWELILVDDCSPDASGAICDEYAQKDGRIRVIHHEKNGGAAKARRTGIDAANGDFIGFVDADDWIEANMYSILVEKINALKVDVLMCSYFVNTKSAENAIRDSGEVITYSTEKALEQLHLIDSRVSCMLWDKLYRREVISDYYDDIEIIVGEDYSLLVKTFEQCSSFACIDLPLYHYRQRLKSVCNAGYNEKRWLCIKNYYSFRQYLLEKYPAMIDVLNCHCLIEEMAVLVSMAKSNCVDKNVMQIIKQDVRKYFKSLLRVPECSAIHRISAVICFISPTLLLLISRIRYSLQKNELY